MVVVVVVVVLIINVVFISLAAERVYLAGGRGFAAEVPIFGARARADGRGHLAPTRHSRNYLLELISSNLLRPV